MSNDRRVWGRLVKIVNGMKQDVVEIARELIQTPSLSGQEGLIARKIARFLEEYDYEVVETDQIGNVIGWIKGTSDRPLLMYNAHMDHVDPGRFELWDTNPYEGNIMDGSIYGRGAADVKGAMGAMIVAGAAIKEAGLKLKGSFSLAFVVEEEQAECRGTRHLIEKTGIVPDRVVLAEATGLNVAIGHRGRAEFQVVCRGKTAHGSTPGRGVNAVYKMLPVIHRIQKLNDKMSEHPFLGRGTVALINIWCKPGKLSIIPDFCAINLDRRLLPQEEPNDALQQLQGILDEIKREDPRFDGEVMVREEERKSYTGLEEKVSKIMKGWMIPQTHPFVEESRRIIKQVLDRDSAIIKWDFATDGSWTAGERGIPTIGFSPCEEQFAHAPNERVKIDYMIGAAKVYAAMIAKFCGTV